MTLPYIESLVAALRAELEEYGEMLALLDQQQNSVLSRSPESILQTAHRIQAHMNVLQNARQRRQQHQRDLALELDGPPDLPFEELIPACAPDYQPLLKALVDQNNHCLFQVQQRAHQNHLLLSRSVELMRKLIGSLVAVGNGPTYDDRGQTATRSANTVSLYEALG